MFWLVWDRYWVACVLRSSFLRNIGISRQLAISVGAQFEDE